MADNSPPPPLLSGATDIVNMLIFSNSEITGCPVNIALAPDTAWGNNTQKEERKKDQTRQGFYSMSR